VKGVRSSVPVVAVELTVATARSLAVTTKSTAGSSAVGAVERTLSTMVLLPVRVPLCTRTSSVPSV
jgi:hypothetical protein